MIAVDSQSFTFTSSPQPTFGVKINPSGFVRAVQIARDKLDTESSSGYQVYFSHSVDCICTCDCFLVFHDTKKAHRSELVKDKKVMFFILLLFCYTDLPRDINYLVSIFKIPWICNTFRIIHYWIKIFIGF